MGRPTLKTRQGSSPRLRIRARCFGVGGEVQVRQLGHGVAHGIVQGATFGVIAAFEVRGGDVHLSSGNEGGKTLEAVAVDQEEIGREFGQDAG